MAIVTTVQLLRPLMSPWQNNLTLAINNLVPESQLEALITRILIAITKILHNLQSAFMLMDKMEIIIITNAKNKFHRIIDHQKIKERFQPSFPWLQPFQTEAKWHLSFNSNRIIKLNQCHKLFHTTRLNSMDNLSNITNIILIIKLIQE